MFFGSDQKDFLSVLTNFLCYRPIEQELKLKGEECERLSHVRDQLEQELEELTASLFEVSSMDFSVSSST